MGKQTFKMDYLNYQDFDIILFLSFLDFNESLN